jgi:hypothetical protein
MEESIVNKILRQKGKEKNKRGSNPYDVENAEEILTKWAAMNPFSSVKNGEEHVVLTSPVIPITYRPLDYDALEECGVEIETVAIYNCFLDQTLVGLSSSTLKNKSVEDWVKENFNDNWAVVSDKSIRVKGLNYDWWWIAPQDVFTNLAHAQITDWGVP